MEYDQFRCGPIGKGEAGFEKVLNESDMICSGLTPSCHLYVIFVRVVSYRVFPSLGLALEQIEDDEVWLGSTTGHTSDTLKATQSIHGKDEGCITTTSYLHFTFLPLLFRGEGVFLVWVCIDFCFAVFPLGTHCTPPCDSYLICACSRSALCPLRAQTGPGLTAVTSSWQMSSQMIYSILTQGFTFFSKKSAMHSHTAMRSHTAMHSQKYIDARVMQITNAFHVHLFAFEAKWKLNFTRPHTPTLTGSFCRNAI